MSWRKFAAAAAVAAGCVLPAQAAYTGAMSIAVLKAQTDGLFVRLTGFTNSDPAVACATSDFWLTASAENHKERVAFLLATYMGGRTVVLSYCGCHSNGHINLYSVSLSD